MTGLTGVTYLDVIRVTRERVSNELDALARERSPFYVLGVYYATAIEASKVKGRAVDRALRDLERLDAAIARLTLADEPVDDASDYPGGDCPDCGEVVETDGAMLCDSCMADLKARRAVA